MQRCEVILVPNEPSERPRPASNRLDQRRTAKAAQRLKRPSRCCTLTFQQISQIYFDRR